MVPLDPAHGPVYQRPLVEEACGRLAHSGRCKMVCGFIGGSKCSEIRLEKRLDHGLCAANDPA